MATVTGRGDLTLHSGPNSALAHGTVSPRSSGSRNKAMVPSSQAGDVTLPDIRAKDNSMNKQKPLPTSLQSDFIPEDILTALMYPPPQNEKLGPPSRYRNLNTTAGVQRKVPASVWNFPKRREKLKHLTENTPCVCGAGKDISFLYDVPVVEEKEPKPGLYDSSAVRVHDDVEEDQPKRVMTLPDTLIPDEYHIVKNKGVMGLEYHEEKFATQASDHEKHLVQFPSLNPTSRFEVLQLQKTLHEMLEKIGAHDFDRELNGPTQMHNLLELIKKEQNIYNVVFHELIRQVSVECLERGELLAHLRDNYSSLLNKVPRQIKGLHEEVLAQRALDRRLTEELMRFKTTISSLTSELTSVKEHDQEVTGQANKAQDELKAALAESRKNAGLLEEYHDLYELQRQRLEKMVGMLSEEKEIWSTAAYSLALKVMEEHSLNTAKRLHVSEKSWSKLANHFTILLSDNDTEILTKLQTFVDKWRDLMEDFNINTKQREAEMLEQLKFVRGGMQSWIREFEKHYLSKDGHLHKQPDRTKVAQLYADIKAWEEVMSQESEKFGGDTVLTGQEFLSSIRLQMFGWTDCAMKIFGRHRAADGKDHPDQIDMLEMNKEVERLLGQFSVRLTGENGVATGVIHISNMLESWDSKINTLLHGSNPLPDQDWIRFYQLLDDWSGSMADTIAVVGDTQREDVGKDKTPHRHIELNDVMKATQKWMSSTTNGIDSEDAKLVEAVDGLHTEMIKWMVQMLLRLAPDRADHSAEAKQAVLLGSATVGQLQANAKSLFSQLSDFSSHVTMCCKTIVTDDMQHKLDLREENADQEYNALKKLGTECAEWIEVAKLMLTELTGEVFNETPSSSLTDMLQHAKPEAKGAGQVNFYDHEKLQTADTQPDSTESTQQPEATEEVANPTPEETAKLGEEPKDEAANDMQQTMKEGDTLQPEQGTDEPNKPESPHSEKAARPESPPTAEQLEIIGHDANTHKQILAQKPDEAPPHSDTIKPEERPDTPNTKRAYEAIAALESLQAQLLSTEERAQQAEDRATYAEACLKVAKEKVRALQRELGIPEDSVPKPESSPQVAEDPKSSQPAAEPEKIKEPSREKSKEKVSRSSSKTSTKSKKK